MAENKEKFANDIIDMMSAQFGKAVKSYWVYIDDLCPGCCVNDIGIFYLKGKEAICINGFMYRDKGVLISYMLCRDCAKIVLKATPDKPSPVHTTIETTLKAAYNRYISSLDA